MIRAVERTRIVSIFSFVHQSFQNTRKSMERHTCLMIFSFIIYGGFSLYAVVTSLYAVT